MPKQHTYRPMMEARLRRLTNRKLLTTVYQEYEELGKLVRTADDEWFLKTATYILEERLAACGFLTEAEVGQDPSCPYCGYSHPDGEACPNDITQSIVRTTRSKR